jgi:TRAP-type C4-dicarboxylate transport system substrate-binding protein
MFRPSETEFFSIHLLSALHQGPLCRVAEKLNDARSRIVRDRWGTTIGEWFRKGFPPVSKGLHPNHQQDNQKGVEIMSQKKWYLTVLALSLIAAVAIGFGASAALAQDKAPAAKQIVLKLSQPTPPTGFYGEGYAYFAKAVEEETKGQVKVQVYPSASLVADTESFDAVRKGTIDIGHFASPWLSPTAKELTPFEIPGAFPGEKHKELDAATRPLLDKIFAKYGVKYIGVGYPETVAFAATKKIMVKSPADLKGKAVRTAGKWGGEAIKMWGGSPVAITLGDLAVALQRGTVDVVYTSWIVIDSFKLYESAPNITFTSIQNILTGMIMSERASKLLDAEQHQAVMRAEKKWRDFIDNNYKNLRTQFEERIKKSGGTFYSLTDEENAAFKKVRQPLFDQIKELSGSDGQALIKAFDTIE